MMMLTTNVSLINCQNVELRWFKRGSVKWMAKTDGEEKGVSCVLRIYIIYFFQASYKNKQMT